MIPGVNDSEEHLRAIAALTQELPSLSGVEVLPYHDTGAGKYERIGQPKPQLATSVPKEEEIARWRAALSAAGCVGLL
jgi:pyruvate formate lyase activating enzyme